MYRRVAYSVCEALHDSTGMRPEWLLLFVVWAADDPRSEVPMTPSIERQEVPL